MRFPSAAFLSLIFALLVSVGSAYAAPTIPVDENPRGADVRPPVPSPESTAAKQQSPPAKVASDDPRQAKPSPPVPPLEEAKPSLAERWFDRVRNLGRRSPNEKNSDKVREAFRSVVAKASLSTVDVLSGTKSVSLGTVVSADGYILTKASELGKGELFCRFRDGKKLPAKVVGLHDEHDLAMLKVDATDLVPVEFSKNDISTLGTFVVTAAPDDDPLTFGVLSATSRKIHPQPGILGVSLADGDDGAKIEEVMPKSPAEKAGLKKEDIVLSVNGKAVKTREQMVETVRTYKPGDIVRLRVKRGNDKIDVTATLGSSFTGPNPAARGDFQNTIGGKLSDRRAGFVKALQHDTTLTPNQCGGPLVDLDGNVIGINIARAGRVESFALPASVVVLVIDDLKSGKFAPPNPEQIALKVAELEIQIADMASSRDEALQKQAEADKDLSAAMELLKAAQAKKDAAQKNADAARKAAIAVEETIEKLKSEQAALEAIK